MDIEAFLCCLGQYIVGELENGVQAAAEHVVHFRGELNHLAAEKDLKNNYYNVCKKLNIWRKYHRKTSFINLKLG